MNDTIERSQTHATFVIERTYPAPVEAVWHALSDNAARDQWFGGGPQFDIGDKSHEFRIGGHGVEDGQWHGGPRSRFVSTYTDIVENQRIVFTVGTDSKLVAHQVQIGDVQGDRIIIIGNTLAERMQQQDSPETVEELRSTSLA